MGTDIHGVFQRRDKSTGKWCDVPSDYQQKRHYQLFAVLAGVRNGYGVAGLPTGRIVTPIAEPRGTPIDFAMTRANKTELWLGNHSYSWLTGDEMLAWFEKAPEVEKVGILDRSVYEKWDGVSEPRSYCTGVFGTNVVQINDNEVEKKLAPHWTHIQCFWHSALRVELAYFFDEVARLKKKHGDVRFVFGFDG